MRNILFLFKYPTASLFDEKPLIKNIMTRYTLNVFPNFSKKNHKIENLVLSSFGRLNKKCYELQKLQINFS